MRPDAPTVLTQSAKGCLVLDRGVLVAIRRAPLDGVELSELHRAIEAAAGAHPRGMVMLSAIRLSPDFPIDARHAASLREMAESARAIDRVVVANATVLEFSGVRAAALRTASRALWSLAKMRGVLGHFERLTDAIAWLSPYANAVGAASDAATYVQLYRSAELTIEELDAQRWVRGEPVRGVR